MTNLNNDTTALIGAPDYQRAIDVIGATLGPQAALQVMQGIQKVRPMVPTLAPTSKQEAENRVIAQKASELAARSVSVPASSGTPNIPFLPDYGLFKGNARTTSRLTSKWHKSTRFQPAAAIFTPAGDTQFITLDGNAAALIPGISALTPNAMLTQIQYGNTANRTQLRLALAFVGYSVFMQFRNGPTSPTPAGLQITSAMMDEWEQQMRFAFYNNGERIDYEMYGTEVPTPGARRIYEANSNGTSMIRGGFDYESFYPCPSPVVVAPNAAFGLVSQGAPADLVATVNQDFSAEEDDTTSSFTFGVILHWATLASDFRLLQQAYMRDMQSGSVMQAP